MPRRQSSPNLTNGGERALIAALVRNVQQRGGRYPQLRAGIGDDCAVLRVPPSHEIVVTTDLLLETVHFRRDWHGPEEIGHRCLTRGLSDLAAMAARPLAAFLSFAVPEELAGAWVEGFLDGLLALAQEVRVPLAGGDTAQAPPGGSPAASLFSADIVLLGTVPTGRALLRSGAQPGDALYVTGALGGAAAELQTLGARQRRFRKALPGHPHLFPKPRLAQGLRLQTVATAAIDISDGLSTDLAHLCESSGVRAEVNGAALPVHALAQKTADPLALALHGGEDYELLFTARGETRIPRIIAGIAVTRIGRILGPRRGAAIATLVNADGTRLPLRNLGWEHFRSARALSPGDDAEVAGQRAR